MDFMENCKGFVNNSSPIETEFSKKVHNYRNLKTQCYFKLAELVNLGKIGCYDLPEELKGLIIEDSEQIKMQTVTTTNNILKERKLDIINKEKIYESLRRSPDFSDAMSMRCYFDLDDYYIPHIV